MDSVVAFGPQHFWLGHLLSKVDIQDIEFAVQAEKMHNRFLFPYTRQGEYGFTPLQTVEQQAFCQALAHRGCIPAALLFGYSLSYNYPASSRVLCTISSLEYLLAGLTALLCHHRDVGFNDEFTFLYGNTLLYKICLYVLEQLGSASEQEQRNPVIEFCEWMVGTLDSQLHLDS
ncbi:hypothetical protein ACFO3I_02730 [Rheinheimera marina]|uniref:Uncharacterized protein n=1 Tax=Rheinheimera marina TaxID=1774958 RepID=A0ABV9JJJ3_9GAMM